MNVNTPSSVLSSIVLMPRITKPLSAYSRVLRTNAGNSARQFKLEIEPGRVLNLCACGAPLFARYDLERAANSDGIDIDGSRNVRISEAPSHGLPVLVGEATRAGRGDIPWNEEAATTRTVSFSASGSDSICRWT